MVKWSSIRAAIRRIGLGMEFEKFAMNSLQGTTLSMKNGTPGRMTPPIEMHRAIKQGCPLAPLLFILVMDELHSEYRKIGGYRLGAECTCHAPPTDCKCSVATPSVGYCDDSSVLAHSMDNLIALDQCTQRFFAKHGFLISTKASASVMMGRHADGSDLRPDECIHWAGQANPLNLHSHSLSARHLGLLLNMDLCWDDQIKKMNGMVLGIASAIATGRVTLLQASALLKTTLTFSETPTLNSKELL